VWGGLDSLAVKMNGALDGLFCRACLKPDCVFSPLPVKSAKDMWIANEFDKYKPETAHVSDVDLDVCVQCCMCCVVVIVFDSDGCCSAFIGTRWSYADLRPA
jgi:hypothetical protein